MNRYRLIYTLLLTALMASTNASAGVTVKGNVYGGGNKADVKTNTQVNIGGGTVEGNVYGGGNLGDVGTINKEAPNMNYKWTNETGVLGDDYTYNNTGVCTVSITNGTIGRVEGNQDEDHGNVFGGGKGLEDTYECEKAMVYKATVIIGNGTVKRNTYGGGKVGRVENDTRVTIGLGGESDGSTEYYEKQTGEGGTVTYNKVTVAAGQSVIGKYVRSGVEGSYVYTLIEANAHPVVEGCVFGAGAGVDTHGYSALVRGDASVTVQGNASVKKNVYGGGEKATVGRYWVSVVAEDPTDHAPSTMPPGMPYKTKGGGACTVKVLGNAVIGPDGAASENAGHVFGAGQGIAPSHYLGNVEVLTDTTYMPKRMMRYSKTSYSDDDHKKTWEYYGEGTEFVWDYFNTREKYFNFLQTLALATETHVTINGTASPTSVKGSVYGGSESGFVQDDTKVTIESGVIGATGSFGNVFGGGKGLATFAEAGKVKGNTNVAISGGTMYGTVYGGGELGDVGTITKTDIRNYTWKANTGKCEVEITGTSADIKGNVFGAGKGEPDTFWCEKAMADNTNVSITNGTVGLNVYGGGEKGRVEHDTEVTIGEGTSEPEIGGSVFGAGKGVVTHGYSALVRNNTTVTIQAKAKIGKSIYGGGEIASVGKYALDAKGMPSILVDGGQCTVTVKDDAVIGLDNGGNVFGAGWGNFPAYSSSGENQSKRMMTYNSSYKEGGAWAYTDDTHKYVWEYFTEAQYSDYLKTLALATHPIVTIGSLAEGTEGQEGYVPATNPVVHGSVYGGGEKGITKGAVDVDIKSGTIDKDVYGGGALADTNTGNWSPNKNYVVATTLTEGETYFTKEDVYTEITNEGAVAEEDVHYYTKSGETYVEDNNLNVGDLVTGKYTKSEAYTAVAYEYATAHPGTYYETEGGWTDASGTAWKKTIVNLLGGTIKGDAYGGGLGQKTGFNSASSDIEATVWGDIAVQLGDDAFTNATSFWTTYDTDDQSNSVVKSGRVFGCNNLNGSPKGNVTVTVWRTVPGKDADGNTITKTPSEDKKKKDESLHKYELAAVYGGGNLASYTAIGKKTHVIINGCENTSIETVYGGGNAARVPETDVDINSCYEIGSVFGGGNGKDKYTTDGGTTWKINPGANVGTEAQPGNANTMIYGGTVHEAYGASNEKGTVYGNVVIDVGQNQPGETCTLDVAKLVGAGKNADVNGNLILVMGCKPNTQIPLVYGGADNANVNGNVELTVTSGWFGKVFGGNNESGAIRGHIKLNIEETGTCDTPIKIEELYLGGNEAAYSVYGYYVKTRTDVVDSKKILKGDPNDPEEIPVLKNGKLIFLPRLSADDHHLPVKSYTFNETQNKWTWEVYPGTYDSTNKKWNWEVSTGVSKDVLYEQPVLNIISCTRIGAVFGGGLGETAIMCADPTVNINMEPGALANQIDRDGVEGADNNPTLLGEIGGKYTNDKDEEVDGGVYGGGNAAAVYGNTTVNIGTETEVQMTSVKDENGVLLTNQPTHTVTGAYIVGNVYGGGKLADVGKYHEVDDAVVDDRKNAVIDLTGNTNVNIGAKLNTSSNEWESVTEGTAGVFIGGNVYGGGMGDDTSFFCDAAMVLGNKGTTESSNDTNNDGGGTHVRIGNGTINGNVYGGGKIARVERNTEVTIGFGEGVPGTPTTNKPVIMGTVFGAGAGLRTHGYSALVRGHSSVTIEGNAKVMQSVYGGGEMATVGRYQVTNNIAEYNISGGKSTVTIGGYAEIGPDDMKMDNGVDEQGKPLPPDDYGHVFGAGKGIQPYEGFKDTDQPWSKIPNGEVKYTKFNDLSDDDKLPKAYATYIRTLALTTETDVTIKDHAFVKGSVYGGSENGFVQKDTHVTIQDDCQIGNGYVQMAADGTYLATKKSVNRRYTADEWSDGHLIDDLKDGTTAAATGYTSSLPECASWPYGQAANDANKFAPYDKDANTTGDLTKYANGNSTEGGRAVGDDGHSFFGNVFGGGSGYYPYKPGRWFVDAGAVYGNARVDITGGHILTSVYGGNELTNVGKYQLDSDGKPTTKITSGGKCTITMSGGTVGVPRTLKQIGAHPVTCYLFGAGKGDQRVLFNKSTNVGDVEVNIKGGTIYGSVFGGGEDGHVMRDVKVTIENTTVTSEGENPTTTTITPTIGTWGTSYVDGNVFGGGRGFSGDAYTAGNVAGSVKLEIKGGDILGSVYGGGRLGSVGYGLFESTNTANYGVMQDDNKDDEGNTTNFYKEGDVGLGRGHIDITISGGTIGNDREYIIPNATNMAEAGIPEEDRDISKWNNTNNYWTKWKEYHKIPKTEFDTTTGHLTHTKGGNVFAGGMGNFYKQDGQTYINGVDWWKLGNAKSTTVTITGGKIKSNVYGGGELGQVVGHHTTTNAADESINASTEISISGSSTQIGTEVKETVAIPASGDTPASTSEVTSYTFGSVFGGGYGSLLDEIKVNNGTSDVTSNPKFIAGLVKEDTKIDMQNGWVKASIYGGGEMASVGESTTSGETTTATGSTYVSVSGGTVGIAPIDVSGSKRYFGGAKMGNVYGGGSGHNNTVRSGRILKNTNVTISDGTIYHNVYGGGAYGTVGEFNYSEDPEDNKVIGVGSLKASESGVATVTITGGTIGYDGNENGMVFGSSRGDINEPGARDDHCAWVYDTNVIIGTEGSETGPQIKGTVYGSGENGHTYNNTKVTIHSGTIGIESGMPLLSNGKTCEGAAYPNRGNVYGGGCGTDTYPVTVTEGEGQSAVTKTIQAFNPLAGIVYGTTTVNINGGKVVRNVYGAGAMGSVGKTTWTTTSTTTGDVTTTTKSATTSGGSTTINISGGTIGVSGTVGDGNLFGAARGSKAVVQADRDDLSRVSVTKVNVSGGLVKGNVYGGGELGDVGTIVKNTTDYNYTWEKSDGGSNVAGNNKITGTNTNTGICNVTITGGTIGSTTAGTGNVFGGGKGDANTWWCEKAMAFATNVSISEASGANTVVYGTVYGGGEIGRVEDDAKVIIGTADGSDTPQIIGSVFGAGKGLATRGYSALVRGNSIVTVQGSALVGGNVFGGGEEASLGRFNLVGGLPKTPQSGGSSEVTIQDNAKIGSSGTGNHVYGAGQGVTPNYVGDYTNFKSMQLEKNKPSGDEGDTWDYYVDDDGNTSSDFVWVYYKTKEEYLEFLKTLALASHPTVTIAENATVFGDVYGGGQRGLTLGDVTVNITGGTVKQDVYGGGSLADTNKGNWDDDRYVAATVAAGASVEGLYTITGTDDKGNPIYTLTAANATSDGSTTYYRKGTWAADKYNATTHVTTYKTNVNLTGGTIDGNAYGGGLGQLAKAAVAAQGTEGQEGYVPAQPAMDAVEAKVYGDVLVKLNETTESDNCVIGSLVNANDPVSRNGNIFGCNNLNGSPQAGVTVHIHKTAHNDNEGSVATNKPTKNSGNYELQAVYGGGNLAAYYPDDATIRENATAYVTIDGCELTSIGSVYGGGNAASVPATEVVINGTYEIGEAFGGGNGKDRISYDGTNYEDNPGANVGLRAYPDANNLPYDTKQNRDTNYGYGPGKSHITIYGGTVHSVYGGSNLRGNVRVESRTTLEDADNGCDFNVGKAYGGGNNAPQDGDAVLEIGCISGLEKAYGGASNADVNGDVVLNITNGTYGRVFGGNDLGGNITGSITVNIEETGCRPIIIGELYGGGNEAGYSIYGYKKVTETVTETNKETGKTTTKEVQVWRPRESSTDSPEGVELSIPNPLPKSPQVNVKSFTSIGTVYGGGYGGPATMVGSPEVNINVFEGEFAETYNGDDNVIEDNARIVGSTVTTNASISGYGSGYPIPSHAKGAIGAINNVFGGGNAAEVIGTPHVNIGTLTGEVITLASKKIEDSEGKAPTDEGWIPSYQLATVKGVDIRGNVYGAGNNAKVTGDTEVVIGKNKDVKTYIFKSFSEETGGTAWSSGLAQTTGVTKNGNAEVVILSNGKYTNFVGQKYYVAPDATTNGSTRTALKDASGNTTGLWVAISEHKIYNFTSYGASTGGTQYSTGTAAPTGNFKTIDGQEYMQIQVLTNPGETSWEGKTFFIITTAKTDGTKYQLYKANGTKESVWVEITE